MLRVIKIRFNTEKLKDTTLPPWRVIIDGQQRLAQKIYINAPAETSVDEIAPGVYKWHITINDASIIWNKDGTECTVVKPYIGGGCCSLSDHELTSLEERSW
jgi:hypothetical protein